MMNTPLRVSPPQTAAPACPACAYPRSEVADELGSPVILSPSAREVPIDWRRTADPRVRVVRLGTH